MPESDDRREQLSRLWLDVLVEDEPDSELLTRYAGDPDSLSPEERAAVEARRDEPRVADRLRVLEGFDAAQAGGEADLAPLRPEPLRAPARRGWRSWLAVGPLALAGAAAAALAIAILVPEGPGPLLPEGDTMARARPLPDEASPVPAEPELPAARPAPPGPAVRQRRAVPGIDPSRLAELTAQAPTPGPTPEPEASSQPAPEPAPAPAPIFTAEARSAPEADSAAETAPALDLFEGEIEGAPMLVASAIDYATPSELIERPWARTYRSLAPPGTEPAGEGPQLRALVPEHVAFTASASPSLFWYLSEAPRPGWRVLLELAPSDRPEQGGEAVLPVPDGPGVQRVRLADLDVELEPGVEYVWTITVQPDPLDPARDVSTQGWVRRVELAGATREQLAGRPLSNALVYADAGLWYDALGAIAEAIALRPDLAANREAYRRLLAGAGLTEYATHLPR